MALVEQARDVAPDAPGGAGVTRPTQLYRYWDADGNLLYVGISFHAIVRASTHRATSHWYSLACRMEIETFPDRSSALIAERNAIRDEKPIHNVKHNSNTHEEISETESEAVATSEMRKTLTVKEKRQLNYPKPAEDNRLLTEGLTSPDRIMEHLGVSKLKELHEMQSMDPTLPPLMWITNRTVRLWKGDERVFFNRFAQRRSAA